MHANYQSEILTIIIIYLKEKVIKTCYNSHEKFIDQNRSYKHEYPTNKWILITTFLEETKLPKFLLFPLSHTSRAPFSSLNIAPFSFALFLSRAPSPPRPRETDPLNLLFALSSSFLYFLLILKWLNPSLFSPLHQRNGQPN